MGKVVSMDTITEKKTDTPDIVSMDRLEGATPLTSKQTVYDSKTDRVIKHPNTVTMDELGFYIRKKNEPIKVKPPEQLQDMGLITSPSQEVERELIPELFTLTEQIRYGYERVLSQVIEKPSWAITSLVFRALKGLVEYAPSAAPSLSLLFPSPLINKKMYDEKKEKAMGWLTKGVEYYSQPEKYGLWTPQAEKKRSQYRQANYQKNYALGIAGDLAEAGTDLMSLFLQMGAVKAASLPTTLSKGNTLASIMNNFKRLGIFGFLTREGDIGERAKGALTLIGYNMTPYIANATGATGWGAVGVDTLLNTFLTSPTYMEAYKKSGGFTKEFVSMALPQFVMDVGMAWRTRGLPGNIRNKQIQNYISGRMKTTEMPVAEGVKMISKMQEQIKDNVKPAIKGQIEKTQKQEIREKRAGVKPIEQEVKETIKSERESSSQLTDIWNKAQGEKETKTETKKRLAKEDLKRQIEKVKSEQVYTKKETLRKNADKGLEKVKKLEQNLKEFDRQKELRQTIHAWRAVKDMSKSELDRIAKKRTGHKKLTHPDLMVKDLEKILKSVKQTRPKYIKHKRVVTKKTERKINQLKNSMIKKGEMTQEDFENILDIHKVTYLGYRSGKTFITESQGKAVLKDMVYTSPIIKERTETKKALDNNPVMRNIYNRIENNFANKFKNKTARVNGMLDMHHFADSMEKQTGLPFGSTWERLNETRQQVEQEVDRRIEELREAGGKSFNKISKDEASLDRIQDYIASKLPKYYEGKPTYPKGITPAEKKIADTIIKRLKGFEEMVRYNRFYDWYEEGTRIPNAPGKELRKAADILESKGDEALREWLGTRDWGVIKSGYYIGEVLQPKVRGYQKKAALGKKGLRAKETVKYRKPERDILKRYISYTKSMLKRTELKKEINAWKTLFNNNTDSFYDPKTMAQRVERNLDEILGNRKAPDGYEKYLKAAYSQAMRAVFLDLRKGVRNLFQNMAFYTSLDDALRIKGLNKADRDYYKTFVSQSSGIKKDWLYADVNWIKNLRENDKTILSIIGKGLTPLEALNSMADAVNIMGRTDDINRSIAFKMKLGAVRRGLKNNPDYLSNEKKFNKMMKDIGIGDLTLMETKHAIKKLATEGEDAFARYVAKGVTQKVHFLYERAQREPMAQGNELSRVLSNLLTFRKGYFQRLVFDLDKFRPSDKALNKAFGSRRRATRSLIGATVFSSLVGAGYMLITGDDKNPYRADHLMGSLSLGGLATGAQEQINEFSYTAMQAVRGDERAKGKLMYLISRTNDTFIPFYDDIFNILEAVMDTERLDQQWMEQVRESFDKRYRAKPDIYWRKMRNNLEKGQHAIFGTEQER